MEFDVLDGERIIRKSIAMLRRDNQKCDGHLCLSDIRLRFNGIDQENWSYPLGAIMSVKLHNVFLLFAEGIAIKFNDERKEIVEVHKREDWAANILSAKYSYETRENIKKIADVTPTALKRAIIRKNITDYFDDSELRTLCYYLSIDYDNLAGDAKEAKARELIVYCERRGITSKLVSQCQELRPNVRWLSISKKRKKENND